MVRCRVKIGFIILVSGIAYVLTAEILAQERFYKTNQPIIVIDPGHGGRASGVRGPTGILEKTAVLALAQTLVSHLEADFRVKLTRTDDYDLTLADRTAIANQSQAALFISLHTGGSFLYQTDGMTVFYFTRKEKEAPFSEPLPDDLDNPASPHWKSVQERYVIDSKILAFTLQHHFEAVTPDVKIRVQQAPLAILMGANMPAILI
ncbi:N-acetylmuramoyl-L-alanine amidase, partial [Desulfococcaceae bacterium HSG7]|nr:N-acetylmuramoyl-L-alanine amidase [Desulfococcaceae bacterium HSG7]